VDTTDFHDDNTYCVTAKSIRSLIEGAGARTTVCIAAAGLHRWTPMLGFRMIAEPTLRRAVSAPPPCCCEITERAPVHDGDSHI
jgi:hypothetical protein